MAILFTMALTIQAQQTSGTFTDSRDGNVYKWVKIGNQIWMAENLKYLPSVVGPSISSNTTPFYYVYDYNSTNVTDAKTNYTTYGVLYNWLAAMNACPSGWHLPSDAEWRQLTTAEGGMSIASGKLKEVGTTHWINPNAEATDETSFNALPGGCRVDDGTFSLVGQEGYWWCSTQDDDEEDYDPNLAFFWNMKHNSSKIFRSITNKEFAFSVRCIKD